MARMSPFVVLSLGLCCATPARAEVPAAITAAIPPATTEQIQQTVDRAIGYMQTESAAWLNTRKCAACHHVPIPLWALSEAGRQLADDFSIDPRWLARELETIDTDHLRRQFLGYARPGETCAEAAKQLEVAALKARAEQKSRTSPAPPGP